MQSHNESYISFSKIEHNVIGDLKPNNEIHRIYKKENFLKLLTEKNNYLPNVLKWDDPYENFFLKSSIRDKHGSIISLEIPCGQWFGQSWTFNADNDAMWRIYSSGKQDNNTGILVKTTVEKLYTSFYKRGLSHNLKYFIGKINYLSKTEIAKMMQDTSFSEITRDETNSGIAKLLCIKRDIFSHENELRLLYWGQYNLGTSDGYEYELDPNLIFNEIIIDPRLDSFAASNIIQELKEKGCRLNISRSNIYELPKFIIRD